MPNVSKIGAKSAFDGRSVLLGIYFLFKKFVLQPFVFVAQCAGVDYVMLLYLSHTGTLTASFSVVDVVH